MSLHPKAKPVPMFKTGAFAIPTIAEGRLIPILMADLSERPDLSELLRLHEHLPPGDVECQWGRRPGASRRVIDLILEFVKPTNAVAILEFDILEEGGIVEHILASQILCLEAASSAEQPPLMDDVPRIILDIPDTGFRPSWNGMVRSHLQRSYRRQGLSKQQSKTAADRTVEEWRRFLDLRLDADASG